jgi:hypothetical protein
VQVAVERLEGGKRQASKATNNSPEVVIEASEAAMQTAVETHAGTSTPKRKKPSSRAAACMETTPDSKHAKRRRLRSRGGGAAGEPGATEEVGGMIDAQGVRLDSKGSEDVAEIEEQNGEDALTVEKVKSMKVRTRVATSA